MCVLGLLAFGVFMIWGSWTFGGDVHTVLSGWLIGGISFWFAFLMFKAYANSVDWDEPVRKEKPVPVKETQPWEPLLPERDANGYLIGYKVLKYNGSDARYDSGIYSSPSRVENWKQDTLYADRPPGMNNSNGIYFTYDANDPVLWQYARNDDYVIAKIRISGKVVHHQIGGRGECAEIVQTYTRSQMANNRKRRL